MIEGWKPVEAALDRAAAHGRRIGFWLRDDDAVDVTPALDRLDRLCARFAMPVLLAVIPQPAEPGLADWVALRPMFTPCQHGFAHRNHAPAGGRAVELGGRPKTLVLDELGAGRAKLLGLFGSRLAPILVPPWNRIDPDLLADLPSLGFTALSTFGSAPTAPCLATVNANLDIIDWRAGRRGRSPDDLARRLVPLIETAAETGQGIGILTHHLAHDEAAWASLEACLRRLASHPATRFMSVPQLESASTGGLDWTADASASTAPSTSSVFRQA
jgi:hypothetical protein